MTNPDISQVGPCCWRYLGVALIGEIPQEEAKQLVVRLPLELRKRISHIHCFPEDRILEVVWWEPGPDVETQRTCALIVGWEITHGVCLSHK